MKVFSKEKFIEKWGYDEYLNCKGWVDLCDGKEVQDGYCRGFIIADEWCIESEEKKMRKSDLKYGDKLTLRNGAVGYYEEDMDIAGLEMHNIKNDLTNNGVSHEVLDIVKVERPVYTTIFEREEEVKEMTVAEISKALGYNVKIVK